MSMSMRWRKTKLIQDHLIETAETENIVVQFLEKKK